MNEFWERYKGLLLAVGVMILSILLSLLIVQLGRGGKKQTGENPVFTSGELTGPGISVMEFQYEDLREDFNLPETYPLRPRLEKWSSGQVEAQLFPPKEILKDILREENRRVVESILKDVE